MCASLVIFIGNCTFYDSNVTYQIHYRVAVSLASKLVPQASNVILCNGSRREPSGGSNSRGSSGINDCGWFCTTHHPCLTPPPPKVQRRRDVASDNLRALLIFARNSFAGNCLYKERNLVWESASSPLVEDGRNCSNLRCWHKFVVAYRIHDDNPLSSDGNIFSELIPLRQF